MCLSLARPLQQSTADWGLINNKIYVSLFRGWESQIKVPADWGSGEDPLPGSLAAFSHCVFTWWEGQGAPWGPFYKGANPIPRFQPHDLMTSQGLLTPSPLGVGSEFDYVKCGGHRH